MAPDLDFGKARCFEPADQACFAGQNTPLTLGIRDRHVSENGKRRKVLPVSMLKSKKQALFLFSHLKSTRPLQNRNASECVFRHGSLLLHWTLTLDISAQQPSSGYATPQGVSSVY